MTLQTDTQALYMQQPFVTYQYRGSCDGIVWSHWRYFSTYDIETAVAVCQAECYSYIQVRKLEDGFETVRAPIQTWEG